MFYSSVVPGKPSRRNERGRAFNLADLFEIVVDTCPIAPPWSPAPSDAPTPSSTSGPTGSATTCSTPASAPATPSRSCSWNRAEWVEAELGIYKARASVINVNYRYVADELRYMLENSDAVAVVFERAFAPMVAEVRPGRTEAAALRRDRRRLERRRLGEGRRGARCDRLRGRARRGVDPGAGFAPRSGDDLYILYTGGTTGMPKGVLWRSEDIFFAALGGGGYGQPPIQTPDELAERIQPADGIVVNIVNAPMMHGGGQWASFIGFFGGNTIVLNCDHHFDGDARRPTGRARARHVDHGRG